MTALRPNVIQKHYSAIAVLATVLLIVSLVVGVFVPRAEAATVSFTTPGTTSWTVPTGVTSVEILVVAGGGGGGRGDNGNSGGGGGGAGGVIYNANLSISGSSISVTVGAGGAQESKGSNSSFGSYITAEGGGAGATGAGGANNPGGNGGSGGGGARNGGGGSATSGQGSNGGGSSAGSAGGGGGGKGAIGSSASGTNGGAGGAGQAYSISGSSVTYGGGGGGGRANTSSTCGAGGSGGGGAGGGGSGVCVSSGAGAPGSSNTGGGGGGGGGGTGGSGTTGGTGGSGVIIIKYTQPAPGTPGTPTFSNVTTSAMRVSWTAASAADSYKVERCEGASCSNFSQIATNVTNLYYDDSGLSYNTSYSYRIRATNGAGDGSYSGTGTQATGADGCTFNGAPVDHGSSVTAYEEATVPFGESCVSQQRTCTNGTLSGTYQYSSCLAGIPDGTPITGYAWSDTIGWISMNGSGYGITIDPDGVLDGYAWSEHIGWVSARESDLSGCPQSPCNAYMSGDALRGWLKVLSADDAQSGGWDGWISLSGASPSYGPTLADGEFTGFAWGDMNVGWLDFNTAQSEVETDYVPCESQYQCVDLTHRDNLCTPTINENEYCGDGNTCLAGGVCGQPVASGALTLSPALVPTGDSTDVSWDAIDTTSCRVFSEAGDEWYGGEDDGPFTSQPIIETTLFTLECANSLGSATSTIDTAYAVVVPTWVER